MAKQRPCELSGQEGKARPKPLSPEMRKRIKDAMWTTWSAIGPDLMECPGEDGRPLGDRGIPGRALFEAVCDSIDTYGDDKEACEVFHSLSYTMKEKIGRERFPFNKRHGY